MINRGCLFMSYLTKLSNTNFQPAIYYGLLLVNGYKAGLSDSLTIAAGAALSQVASAFTIVATGELEKTRDPSYDSDAAIPCMMGGFVAGAIAPQILLFSEAYEYTDMGFKKLIVLPSAMVMTVILVIHLFSRTSSKKGFGDRRNHHQSSIGLKTYHTGLALSDYITPN